MPKQKADVLLIEGSSDRFVLENRLGRVIIEANEIRFHRAGKGRGRVLLSEDFDG